MKVIVMNKSNFNVIQLNNVTSITYSDGNVTITAGTSATYSLESYLIQILC